MMKTIFQNFLNSLINSKDQEPDPVRQLNMDPPDPDVAFSHWTIPLMRILRVQVWCGVDPDPRIHASDK
jgi:hypothetical protein